LEERPVCRCLSLHEKSEIGALANRATLIRSAGGSLEKCSTRTEWTTQRFTGNLFCTPVTRHAGASPPTGRNCHQWEPKSDKRFNGGEAQAPLRRRGSSILAADDLCDFRIWYLAWPIIVPSLISCSERIPVPGLGQPHTSLGLLAENERTSIRKSLDRRLSLSSNGTAGDTRADVLRKGLNELLDPDELSEL